MMGYQIKHLDPRILLLSFSKNFFGTAYIIPVWFVGIFILEQLWVNNLVGLSKEFVILLLDVAGLIFLFLLILGCYYWSWLTFNNFTYELQSDGLHIRRGVLFRRHIQIPYQDIEHVEILINPFVSRFLQLETLHIISRELLNTEGILQKSHNEHIIGLASEEARFLRTELLKYSYIKAAEKPSRL